jgi:DNA-binding NarL/FixJ family response regulator
VERTYAAELLAAGNGTVGYLLKDRVTALDEFLDAIERVAAGGTVMDPEVVRQLFARNNRDQGVAALTPRERRSSRRGCRTRPSAPNWCSPHPRWRSTSRTS